MATKTKISGATDGSAPVDDDAEIAAKLAALRAGRSGVVVGAGNASGWHSLPNATTKQEREPKDRERSERDREQERQILDFYDGVSDARRVRW